MPAQLTTKTQVNGYRFMVRRMEHALVRRDVRMIHDPMRSQSRALAVGIVLALLTMGGFGVLALFDPQPDIGQAKIVVGKDSGAMFVLVDKRLHPVLNLASARLVVGQPAAPETVKESDLGSMGRGPMLGIPGAPSVLPGHDGQLHASWTVCDTLEERGDAGSLSTAVIAGSPRLGDDITTMAPGQGMLVSHGVDTFLVYGGHRARVDLRDSAVTRALHLDGVTPRPVSVGLLNAIPEVPQIAPPVRFMDTPAEYPSAGMHVGSVFSVTEAGAPTQYWVVLRDGIQKVSPATADLIRYSDREASPGGVQAVSPGQAADMPSVDELNIQDYPVTPPEIIDPSTAPVSCLSWTHDDDAKSATLSLLTGTALPVPSGAMVPMAGADGAGDKLDEMYMPPGRAAFVHGTGIAPESSRQDGLWLISDSGVRYGIPDAETAKMLGLGEQSDPAPWPIISLLAPGPALDRRAALVTHDGMAPDPSPGSVLQVKAPAGQ